MFADTIRFAPDALRPAGGSTVRLRWLGTAGIELEHDGRVLLIDPYFTRASLSQCALGPLEPNLDLLTRLAPRADAILATHTHFDHALDIPEIAKRTGARVFGSRSLGALCRSAGVDSNRITEIEEGQVEVGPFRIRFVSSQHSPFFFGRVPLQGDIAEGCRLPMRFECYCCGSVFVIEIAVGGRRLVQLGSANLEAAPKELHDADLALLCVAGWRATRGFPERVARELAPKAVLFSHWDNFFSPIEKPARELPGAGLAALARRLRQSAPEIPLGTLPLLGELQL